MVGMAWIEIYEMTHILNCGWRYDSGNDPRGWINNLSAGLKKNLTFAMTGHNAPPIKLTKPTEEQIIVST